MAEQSAKNKRSQALSNFTRCHNILTPLLANPDSPSIVVTPQFEKLQVLWEKLEAAQDSYIELVTNIDVDIDPNGIAYINNAGDRYAESLQAYSEYVNKCQAKENDEKKKAVESLKQEEKERLKTEAEEQKLADELLKAEGLKIGFETTKSKLLSTIAVFKDSNENLHDTLAEASDSDKRRELNRLESDFKSLQDKWVLFSSLDSLKDIKAEKN